MFFSVGEPSGDLHGANLIRRLRDRTPLTCHGLGGPKMQAAGCDLLRDMSDLAVMGLVPVIARLPEFFALRAQVARSLDHLRPDAVVLIDYPGFNWHVARLAKERGIPVFYYGLPQLWAWASWRVRKVQRLVDHALCKLPFEEAWFKSKGCQATYVGHPYFDELAQQKLDRSFVASVRRPAERLLTLLPGSRTQEVRSNLPILLRAAEKVRQQLPSVRVSIASYNEDQAALARNLSKRSAVSAEVHVARTPELIAAADCCLACSGSVSLELLYHAKPAAIVYRVSWPMYEIVRRLVNVRYITLVNLIASRQPFAPPGSDDEQPLYPEYPTWRDCSQDLAGRALEWLMNEKGRQQLIGRLVQLRERIAGSGASRAAAEYILSQLDALPSALRKAS
jgi:lipid-A-disaccharide synthase